MEHYGVYQPLHQLQSPVSSVSPANIPTSNGQLYSAATSRIWEGNVSDRSSSRVRPSSIYSGIQPPARNHNPRSMHDQQSVHGKYSPLVTDAIHNRSTQYLRPQSSIEIHGNLQETACRSLSPCSPYVRNNYSSSSVRKSNINRAPLSSYTRTLAAEGTRFIPTKLSAVTASIERAFKISRLPQIKIPELTGWRAKLAQEGLAASADKSQTTVRKWHYVNEADPALDEETNFITVVCQATQTEHGEEKRSQQSKTISRLRNMKLEKLQPKVGIDIAVQVTSGDIQKRCEAQKLRSLKKNFISSKYTGHYMDGFYTKYVRSSHSKPKNYQQILNNSVGTEVSQTTDDKSVPNRTISQNKSHKKAVPFINMRNLDGDAPTQQGESEKMIVIFSSGSSGEESSPIETGYESHSSDSSRSRFTFSESQSPSTQILGNDELSQSVSDQNHLNAETDIVNTDSSKKQQEEHAFRFYSATRETSQRDSGFMDMVNHCESPYNNEMNSYDDLRVDTNSIIQMQNEMHDIHSSNNDDDDPAISLANREQLETESFKKSESKLNGQNNMPRRHTWVGVSSSNSFGKWESSRRPILRLNKVSFETNVHTTDLVFTRVI